MLVIILITSFLLSCTGTATTSTTQSKAASSSTQAATQATSQAAATTSSAAPNPAAPSAAAPAGTPAAAPTSAAAASPASTPRANGVPDDALRAPGATKTELLYWDKTKAYNGYTLYASSGRTFMLDMEGNVVGTWAGGNDPRLLPNGNILDSASGNGFKEMDWDGKTVWSYTDSRKGYRTHHDWEKVYNPKLKQDTFMYIASKSMTHDEAIALGANPKSGPYSDVELDTIVEVDMKGNIIWEWGFADHLVQDFDAAKANYVGEGKTIADYPGRLNVNLPGRPMQRDWLHCNSMDYNPDLDQVVTNTVQGEFYVVDHGNTFVPGDLKASMALAAGPKGDFLYRFGDPARYNQGKPPAVLTDWTASTSGNKQIGGSHNIQWIQKGLPGEGHFLIFNNGQYLSERMTQSYIFEINGYLDKNKTDTGHYVNPPDAGYTIWKDPDMQQTHKQDRQKSNQIVWMYYSKTTTFFLSQIGSSAQRLPNGNTLICADTSGHFFEVTSTGKVVWDYINPVYGNYGALEFVPDLIPMVNSSFRCYRYGPDDPGLKGKTLTPKGDVISNTPANTQSKNPPKAPAGGGGGGAAQAPAAGGAAQPAASGAAQTPAAGGGGGKGGAGGGGGAAGGGGGAGGGAPVPTLTGVSPNSGPIAGGTVVTIAGNGLGGPAGTVTFGGVAATAISQVGDPPSYQCTTPAHAAGAVDVVLTNGGGTVTSTGGFTYK